MVLSIQFNTLLKPYFWHDLTFFRKIKETHTVTVDHGEWWMGSALCYLKHISESLEEQVKGWQLGQWILKDTLGLSHLPEKMTLEITSATGWNPVSTKVQKISRSWWWAPVVPAAREAEAGESLEPGRQRLQWAEIVPLPSSLCYRARLHLKKRKNYKLTGIESVWHL